MSVKELGGWIGVDLDGTLAKYVSGQGVHFVGEPIAPMVDRVKQWVAEGRNVKIMTARVSGGDMDQVAMIVRWCCTHIGVALEVTYKKDYDMIELWDDRAVSVEKNTGRITTEGRS